MCIVTKIVTFVVKVYDICSKNCDIFVGQQHLHPFGGVRGKILRDFAPYQKNTICSLAPSLQKRTDKRGLPRKACCQSGGLSGIIKANSADCTLRKKRGGFFCV